jgi:hypothetical protein
VALPQNPLLAAAQALAADPDPHREERRQAVTALVAMRNLVQQQNTALINAINAVIGIV